MEKTSDNKYTIGITQGDINGIGYEVIFKALSDPDMLKDCSVVIYGSPKIAAFHRKQVNLSNIIVNNVTDVADIVKNTINIINVCDDNTRVELGNNTIQAGECSLAALHRAQADLKNGAIDILVNAPINYFNLVEAGFRIPSIADSLAQEFGCRNFVQMFLGSNLKVATVSSPMPLSAVGDVLTTEKILWKIRTLAKVLHDDFTIRKPRIAVVGLNPFASDFGTFGREEGDKIHPAILKANEEGIAVFGPYNADGFFAEELYSKFDGVLCMAYEQALMAARLVEKNNAVAYVGGLPAICTAPTHGPAFDIAGKGEAVETSMRNAIYTAIDIYRNRKILEGIVPLRKQTEHEADKKIC